MAARNFVCSNKEIRAHINSRMRSDGTIVLHGYAVESDTLIRIDGCKQHQRTARRPENEETERIHLIGVIDKEYESIYKKRKVHSKLKEGFFTDAFNTIDDKSLLLPPGWASSTAKVRTTYFERQILTRLDKYGRDICSEDLEAIRQDLVAKAAKSKRGNRNAVQAETSVAPYLLGAEYMYSRMRELLPDYGLPDIDIEGNLKRSNVFPEQVKALPNNIRVIIAALLVYRLFRIGLALGTAMMFFCGLRPAEAAAVMIGDIELFGDYGALYVQYQMVNGVRTSILKSSAAHRVVFLPYIAVALIKKYTDYLRSLGYSEDQISKMPLVPKRHSYESFADGSDVSAFARRILILAGCTPEFIQSSITLMVREPDYNDDGSHLADITAYILRRDACSRFIDICGLSPTDTDEIVGHKNDDVKNNDYLTKDSARKITDQLERYVFLPEFSNNPAFKPIPLSHGADLDVIPNMLYDFVADCASNEEIVIDIDVSALEPGFSLTIETPSHGLSVMPTKHMKDSPKDRRERPIIGAVHSQDYYNQLIKEALEIDISTLC